MNIRLIIFDWDGVFTRGSTQGYISCYINALRDIGVPADVVSDDYVARAVMERWGQPFEQVLLDLLDGRDAHLDEASSSYDKHLFGNTFLDKIRGIPGSPKLVEQLSHRYTLAIATGMHPRLLQDIIMPYLKIPSLFSQIESVYDITDPRWGKPHPHMVTKILESVAIDSADSVLVGDSEKDMEMANRAGVTPIAVLTGHLDQATAERLQVPYILPDVTHLSSLFL